MKDGVSVPGIAFLTSNNPRLSRRGFLRLAGVSSAAGLLAACRGIETPSPPGAADQTTANPIQDELGAPATSYENITSHTNYYEFSYNKSDVGKNAKGFKTSPWNVEVSGLVQNPKTYGLEELIRLFPPEEHIYRLRCVEAWSMVIPWNGFSMARLLKAADPMISAKFVRFVSVFKPEEMPNQNSGSYPWPYQEGLFLAEAMHDLTLLATGIDGKELLAQNGAPIRLVIPWKYGYKNIKSIVKIELTEKQPETFWSTINPTEYGFYANVNPGKPHPRWSQANERRIGIGQMPTMLFNGYQNKVSDLYQGVDLNQNY